MVHINDVVMTSDASVAETASTAVVGAQDTQSEAKPGKSPASLQWARRRNSSGKSPEGIRADREAIRELEAQLRESQIKEQPERPNL